MTYPMRPRRIQPEAISMQHIEDETLIYDERHHQAWCLNHSCATVWNLCDGQKTVEQIATAAAADLHAPVSVDAVLLALAELREKNLLEADEAMVLPEGATRREMIGKVGLAAAALLPVVASVFAQPALAQKGTLTGMSNPAGFAGK